MAYRGDQTDPLAIMIGRQRAMRQAVVVSLLLMVVSALLRVDYPRVIALALAARQGLVRLVTPPPPTPTSRLTAPDVEQQLLLAPASTGAPRNHRCVPGAPGLNGWDYICSYTAGPTSAPARMKIGVRVTGTTIVQASSPYPFHHLLPTAAASAAQAH